MTSNQTINELLARKSVRVFAKRPVSREHKELILQAAMAAPTAGNQQLYTILEITDQAVKDRLAVLCDHQPFIARAPLVLVFCADAAKWYRAFQACGCNPRRPGAGDLMLAVSDTNIAAQNAVTAAWSLGIGSCYIGDIMEQSEAVTKLLKLPEFVFPAAMLVFGYPTKQQARRQKPQRSDLASIVHENTYPVQTAADFQAMFGRETGGMAYEEWMQAFCARKYNSDFAREMSRSAENYLAQYKAEDKAKPAEQMPGMIIRREQQKDYRKVEELTREAFWGTDPAGVNEHFLVNKLREDEAYVPELDYLAELDGRLAGHIMYSKSRIVSADGRELETLTFGPLSVLPQYQGQGIGRILVKVTVEIARSLGYPAIVILGHPDYYPRLGFRRGEDFGITTAEGKYIDPLMVLELKPGALTAVRGQYKEAQVFEEFMENADELAAYEQTFPPKEAPHFTEISVLSERLAPAAWEAVERLNLNYLVNLRYKSQRELAALPGIDAQAIRVIKETAGMYGINWGKSSSV